MELLEHAVERPVAVTSGKEFEALYEQAFPLFARFAARMSASFEDAQDIFQDALVIWFEKCQEGNSDIRTSPAAYILGIAKHLWIKRFQKDRSKVQFSALESTIDIPADYYPTVNEDRLLDLIERAGRKCLELLRTFYYGDNTLKQIAGKLGYRNEHTVAAQKYKCLGKLRQFIKTRSLDYENFTS